MKDLIDRQAAIDALAKFVPYAICDESSESYTNGLTDAYNLICQLPSAQPERKKGKWIENTFCSECGWIHEVESGFIGSVKQFNYCPNCGADMRGEQDE